MNGLRRLERDVIRNKCYKMNGTTYGFHEEWEKYKNKKLGITLKKNRVRKPSMFKKLIGETIKN